MTETLTEYLEDDSEELDSLYVGLYDYATIPFSYGYHYPRGYSAFQFGLASDFEPKESEWEFNGSTLTFDGRVMWDATDNTSAVDSWYVADSDGYVIMSDQVEPRVDCSTLDDIYLHDITVDIPENSW